MTSLWTPRLEHHIGSHQGGGVPFPADALAAGYLFHFKVTTPDADGDISAWPEVAGKTSSVMSQGVGANQPTRTADGIVFVAADVNWMADVTTALATLIGNCGAWCIAGGGTVNDSGAAVYGMFGWANSGTPVIASLRRTQNDKMETQRFAGTGPTHTSTNSVASPQSGMFYAQGIGGTLADTVGPSELDGVAFAPAAVTAAITNAFTSKFGAGSTNNGGSNPADMTLKWIYAAATTLSADQKAALLAWHNAGAVYP